MMLPQMLRRTASTAVRSRALMAASATQGSMAFSSSAGAARSAASSPRSAPLMAGAGLVGGAGLLWACQPPAPAQNAAAGAAAGTQGSSAASAGAAQGSGSGSSQPAAAAGYHYKPVYDIDIANKNYPREVPAFIEVSKNSREKYEWDSELGLLRLDRILHGPNIYPYSYGFIPQTLCEDGDPLDVLVMGDFSLEPGCIVDVRVLGHMVMEDEKGMDEKVLAVLTKDPRMSETRTLRDVPEHILREISCFFEQYKVLEREKWAKVGGWRGTADTCELVEKSHQSYLEKKKKEAAGAK